MPPRITEAVFTKSTASNFEVKSLVTPTAKPTLSSNIEIPTGFQIWSRKVHVTAKYRLHVQGVIVRENIPIIAYTPIMLGVSIPVEK